MERVYLDTNVLFPMTLMDLLLSMAEDFHHDIIWTDYLLAEWQRVIVREKRRTPEQATAITDAIRHAFPAGRVASGAYESLIDSVPGPDDDDRVHGAAAIAGRATALVTANTRHFDAAFFRLHDVAVETPDGYLLRRLAAAPESVVQTIQRVTDLKRNPQWTVDEYLERLGGAGARLFVAALRDRIGS